jgi:hypothetical protein
MSAQHNFQCKQDSKYTSIYNAIERYWMVFCLYNLQFKFVGIKTIRGVTKLTGHQNAKRANKDIERIQLEHESRRDNQVRD